jgi:endonuclease YncB( thermonuclease family)
MSGRSWIGAGPVRWRRWRRSRPHYRVRTVAFSTVLFSAVAIGPAPPQAFAADAAPATDGVDAVPTVEEWLNQNVRLRETVQAMNRPSADGKPSGEIRSGAEVKAIGLVAGKRWVEIELPDHSQAYVPREAIEYEGDTATPSPPAEQQGTSGPPAASSPSVLPAVAPASASGAIRGKVDRVPNAATLVIGDQRIRLAGIDPGPPEVLEPFENWVKAQADLVCEPDAQTGRYHCLTGAGVDVAQAAILNGTGRVGDGAAPEYRDSETQARTAKRGLWGQP